VEETLGSIDGMVACAGISPPSAATEMSDEVWSRCLDVNLTGMFRSVRPVGQRMVARKRGAIVTISSVDGMGGHAGRAHYTASKHGVIGLTRALAIEWGRYGVRVNAIAPGVVDTPLLRANIPPDHLQYAMIDRVPMGRLARAEEQAGPTLFLLSDAASYVNGSVLTVDGGTSAGYFTRWNGADLGSRALLEAGAYGEPS
jgi:NAD(P)-dependent dehydrogenase (short-subunit alcohol dehydrogenase family)